HVLVDAKNVGELQSQKIDVELLGEPHDVPLNGPAQVGRKALPRWAGRSGRHATSICEEVMKLKTAATPRERGYLSAPIRPGKHSGMTEPSTISCATCGAVAQAGAKFCGDCGASLGPRRCSHCGAELSSRARFCHRCGRPVAPGAAGVRSVGTPAMRSEQTAWIVAASVVAVLIGVIVWWVARGTPAPATPEMANPGAGGAAPFAGGSSAGAAPDISQMSPLERFDRLFNRVMSAADRSDSATVKAFTPM